MILTALSMGATPAAFAVSLIICASAAAAAVTGFGFNLLSTPLLTLIYPPRDVVVLTLVLGVFASGMLLLRREIRQGVNWSDVSVLFLSSLLGMPAGMALLSSGHPRTLKVLIAGLTVLFAVVMLTRLRPRVRLGRSSIVIVGVVSGFLSTSTSLNGPPVAFYLLARDLPKDQFRGNMVAFVFLATLGSVAVLAVGGAISASAIGLTLRLMPGLVLGFAAGTALARRLSDRGFEFLVLGFLVAVGLLGVISAVR